MKFSELPKEYQDLEKGFIDNAFYGWRNDSDNISERFDWSETPQGWKFWEYIHSDDYLPQIPNRPTIIEELKAINQIKEILESKISCGNCAHNVKGICQKLDFEIEVQRLDSFFCSEYTQLEN